MTYPEAALVIGTDSRHWRRQLGPLAWAALEHLALAAHSDHHGWAAPLGVRDIAAGIGVTKDTAARAVTVLRTAGLVTLEQLDRSDGRRRSGYRLHFPDGIQLRACPSDQDSPLPKPHRDRCPDTADKNSCPNNRDSTRPPCRLSSQSARRAAHGHPRGRRPDRSPAPSNAAESLRPSQPSHMSADHYPDTVIAVGEYLWSRSAKHSAPSAATALPHRLLRPGEAMSSSPTYTSGSDRRYARSLHQSRLLA